MFQGLTNIKKAISTLNPSEVRQASERSLRIALHSSDNTGFGSMENFFLRDLSPARRRQSALSLIRAPLPPGASAPDLHVYSESPHGLAPADALIFHPERPNQFVMKALTQYPQLGVPLARSYVPFRKPFVERVIAKTCRENTMFSIATALPDIIPSVIELPWAVAEFASDTAFLTMNQVRMAFLIGAASDREVGYLDQKPEIAMVIGSAFGWRALARQVIGKIPFGGGLIAKAAVAYAGTKVLRIVARSLLQHRIYLHARGERPYLCGRLSARQEGRTQDAQLSATGSRRALFAGGRHCSAHGSGNVHALVMVDLIEPEVRVLGTLMEKEATTPEYYPLSLNALLNGCNQKSNRDPVVSYDAEVVEGALEGLRQKQFVLFVTGSGRVDKYAQRISETLNLGRRESAVLCTLFLRGPQTLGEIKDRSERMFAFGDLSETERVLEKLAEWDGEALIKKLPRQPGQKEARYAHLVQRRAGRG